jgi:hypothetical protein
MAQRTPREWADLDGRYDVMKRQTGWDTSHMAEALGVKRQTLVDRLRLRIKQGTLPDDVNPWADTLSAHPSTPAPTVSGSDERGTMEHPGIPGRTEMAEVHPSTPEPQGTLEGYREVLEDVQESVPELRQLVPDEEHPSTPEVHPELSPDDSSMAHSGVPARHEHFISTPMVHPGTPTEEDWELWTAIKARWQEIEKILSDRQAMLSTLKGTPGHTQKKTYVFDVRHIALIDAYAQEHRLELKDVIYTICQEFFERREQSSS